MKSCPSSQVPDPQQRPTPQEAMVVGLGDEESPPDAACEDWILPLSDDEDKADVPPDVEWAQPDRANEQMLPEPETVEAVPMLSGAASTPQVERDMPVPPAAGGNEARRRESDTDKLPRQWMAWASKGLLMCTLILGTFFAGLQLFGGNSTVPPVARQESTEANAGDPAKEVDLPLLIVPNSKAKHHDDLLNSIGLKGQPTAPVAVAKPKSTASLYARVRKVVLENKTEETQRLGMGDIAYRDVPVDGSIMVGMEVTYAPFFNHQIIKSVRPIYQKPGSGLAVC